MSLDQISSWMTANNILTLNSSNTEFLLIGLSKQVVIINNFSLTTSHSARNLGFVFNEHLAFLTRCLQTLSLPYSPASLYPSIPRYQNSFHCRHFHCSLQVSDHPVPTDPELSCTRCCQISQIQSHHSHPLISALVKDN